MLVKEGIGETVVMMWRDRVMSGSTEGLQWFCEMYDFKYDLDWKVIYQAAYEWSTGEDLPLEWIEPMVK